ncbi:uncharacterized protein HMPREF1541_00939 [Cyphellophora europaea CBS 101466]|uniref:Zn(2)-C6 fungal-type domain-containing protein n=1 Tax=Cyphellophora europaea (strain CBS 101466) TaxID=1220924 RepID=W2SDQ0_CYPE1|nr:uncharacterized protein HMPREF1541_00939 [Cyphellophora europaea CBS 101466]ETN46750.1 hypothetical protein HMPREF1541_00939 [Cyphellophora europaea CBS 101466]
MTPKSEIDEADIEIKSEGKESPKSTDHSTKTSSKSAAKRRTKTGCLTCRKRRIKCGEEKPFCKNCIKSKRECAGYVQPLVYKQQQGLSTQDPGSRTSLSDGEFRFNEGFGLVGSSSQAHFGPFNPFLSLQNHFAHSIKNHNHASRSQAFHYHPPDPSQPYAHPPAAQSFDSYRRHSFQHHNAHLFGYGAGLPAFTNAQEGSWAGRPQTGMMTTQASYSQEDYGQPTTMMASPGAYSESYAGVPASYLSFDSAPLHADVASDPSPRRHSVYGFVQAAPLDPKMPILCAPDTVLDDDDDKDYASDVDMDDMSQNATHYVEVERGNVNSLDGHVSARSLPERTSRPRHPGTLRLVQQPAPQPPLLDSRNEMVFTHFVNILGPCMSIFERPPVDPWASPLQTLWSYTLPSAAMSNTALAHAILAISGLHIAKLQQSSESPSLKHFTYAARRVGRQLSLPERRHEITTLATVLLLGFYEVLGADHSRWNLHLVGATKLVTEHDLSGLTCTMRRARAQARQMAAYANSALTEADLEQAGIAPSLLNDVDWDVDEKLVSALTGLGINYDTPARGVAYEARAPQPVTERELAKYKTKLDLWWWFCKQDMFQSLVSGERLLMPFEQRRHCPPRSRIGVGDAAYGTFDHLVLLISRLSDFGGKDRHRKQQAIQASGQQWRPPGWLFAKHPHRSGYANPSTTAQSHTTAQRPFAEQASAPANDTDQYHERHRTPNANEGRVRHTKLSVPFGAVQGDPPMFGMMPPPPVPPKMHSSFHAMDRSLRADGTTSPPREQRNSPPHASLEEQTKAALAEHATIAKAFDHFHKCLGAEFQPVPNDPTLTSSPFGPRLRYSSPEIACIWAHYHVGRILLYRLHPDMPPAAMVAAGITSQLTKSHSQIVGQIVAGLFASIPAGNPGEPLSPRYAGALMEITFPILFSSIQYTDMSQRGWTINKLHDIAQMTGWATSGAVAAACEIAWEKLGQAGKGPPYARSLDRNNKDVRINGNLRRLAPQLASSVSELESEHESQFVSHDRSLISKSGPSRVHWAMGLLSVEEDVKKMNIGQD